MAETAVSGQEHEIRPGMIVRLRRRDWRVEGIAGGVLTATPIDDFGSKPQHFVLGLEELQPSTLPEPSLQSLGSYALQRLFLQAIRLDALHGTAPFVAIQRTAVIPVEYQLVPLVMALRQQPARLLIADATGSGKTIEAGLVIAELLARGRARSVLIITPASLREQWQQQMRDLFYLDFEIISGETRKRLERAIPPGADPWHYFDRLILSMDYAKDLKVRPEILKRKWDIVVVDECHNAAMPHGFLQGNRGRKSAMERWKVADDIAKLASTHLLLLSATPHNGYTDTYCSILKMLSPHLVRESVGEQQPRRDAAVRHVCQRTRKDIREWFEETGQRFPFPERERPEDTEVAVELHQDYMRILVRLDKILDFVTLHAENAGRGQAAEWLRLHFHRRALSSPEALRLSVAHRINKLKPIQTAEMQADGDAEEPLLFSLTDQGGADVESEEERDRHADSAVFGIEQELQRRYFEELLEKLQEIKPAKDRKLGALRDKVLPGLLQHAGGDTPARVIVFTRFKDTLTYLEKELKRKADYQIVTLHGDLSEAERDRRFEEFVNSPRAVLLATDVISEGLNLQAAACMVVHYDIPWNPNRLEQRAGRVDRYGQRAPMVYVRSLYCRDTTDEDLMDLLVRKVERMRRDLGFGPPLCVSEETVLRVLTRRRKRRSDLLASFQPGLFDEEEALFDEGAVSRMRSEGFYGQADVRVSDVSERLREMHRRFGSPDQIRDFIKAGLRHYHCAVEERANGTLRIVVSNPRLRVPGVPVTLEKVVLDPEGRTLHPDAIVLDVGHPLVRRLNALIREDALRQTDEGARTAAYYIKGQRGTILLGQGVLRATARTDPPTLLEEVVTFGMRAGLGGMQPLMADAVDEALAQPPSPRPVPRDDALERLKMLSQSPAWSEARENAVRQALASLARHRAKMKAELAASEGSAAWLDGFDQVDAVGFDLYTVTLLLPEGV